MNLLPRRYGNLLLPQSYKFINRIGVGRKPKIYGLVQSSRLGENQHNVVDNAYESEFVVVLANKYLNVIDKFLTVSCDNLKEGTNSFNVGNEEEIIGNEMLKVED